MYCGDHVKQTQSDRAELNESMCEDMEQSLHHERQDHRDVTSGEAARSTNRQLDSLLIRGDKGSSWGLGVRRRAMFAKVRAISGDQKV